MTLVRIVPVPLVLLLVTACSSGTGEGGGADAGDGGRAPTAPAGEASGGGGTTECGPQTCQPGTYCLNLACVPGCLANTNCASDQSCKKSGDNVGSCQNEPTETPLDCSGFCAKSEGCDPKGYAAVLGQCAQAKGRTCVCADVCTALPSACVSCISSSATCADADACKPVCR